MKSRVQDIYTTYKGQLRSIGILMVVFVLLKSVAYFSPLLLSKITSPKDFGEFEYLLNVGMMLSSIISIGLPGAYAYFVMKHGKTEFAPIFHLHFIILSILICVPAVVIPGLLSNVFFGAFVISVAFADQIMVASILKAEGKNIVSVIVDTGIYLLLSFLLALIFFSSIAFSIELWIMVIIVGQVTFSFLFHGSYLKNLSVPKKSYLKEIYGFGILILITSPLFILATNSTRIYIEHFIGYTEVGVYSYFFRIAALMLLLYRVLSILMFRRMFLEDHVKLDKKIAVIMLFIALMGMGMYILSLSSLMNYVVSTESDYYHYAYLFPLMIFQIIFWINTAFFESLLTREKLMKHFIFLLLFIILSLVLSLGIADYFTSISLRTIIIVNTYIIFLLFYGQQWLLRRRNIYYKKAMLIHSILGGIFTIYVSFIII